LRNPGSDYEGTRHNIGAEVVEAFATRLGATFKRSRRRRAEVAVSDAEGVSLLLALPVAFMNECGGPVASIVRYFKVHTESIVLVHDDIDLPFGKLRFQFGRGTGGHNGVASVLRALGTEEVWRFRFGVGRPPGRMDPAEYVLRRFTSAERAEADLLVAEAIDVLRTFAGEGGEAARQHAGEIAGRLDLGKDEPT